MTTSKSFRLFACCHAVKGYSRSIIYDLQYGKYKFIPNLLFNILKANKGKTIADLKCYTKNKYNEGIDLYNNTLKKEGYGFFTNEPELFPAIDLTWKSASIITNAIIEVSHINSLEDINKKIKITDILGCISVQILCLDSNITAKWLSEILLFYSKSRIKSIELVLLHSNRITTEELIGISETHQRINSILIFNSCENKIIDLIDEKGFVISLSKNDYKTRVNPCSGSQSYVINISLFTESQKHNTYFNRKLYFGINGEIKNAPECSEIHGYIQDIANEEELKLIISKSEFQKYWFTHKEIIDICKECEFRHMCVDSRIPLQNKNGTCYHKTECHYNPYIAKWQGEEGYVPVEECGTYNKETGFVVDKKKVKKLNVQIWGE